MEIDIDTSVDIEEVTFERCIENDMVNELIATPFISISPSLPRAR